MKRFVWTLGVVLAVALVALLLGAATGCTPDAPSGPEDDSSADENASRGVLHLVMVTEGRQPDQYEAAVNPWKNQTTREVWLDLDSGAMRESIVDTPTTTQVEGTHRMESLESDGVRTLVQYSEYPSNPDSNHIGAFVSDPEPAPDPGIGNPLLESGDPGIYRTLEASGTAARVAETSETVTLRVDTPIEGATSGQALLVTVRAEDYVPLTEEGERWMTTSAAFPGTRAVTARWVTRYETVEILPHDTVPGGTFELTIPDDVVVHVDRTLGLDEAAESTSPSVYWLGEEYEGYERASEPRLRSSAGAYQNTWNVWGTPNFFGERDSREWAEHASPFKDQMNPVVTIEYGDDSGGLTIHSTKRFDIQTAVVPYKSGITDVDEHLLSSGSAVSLVSQASTQTVSVAVELPDATVVLLCWRMSLEEALAAAEALQAMGER